MPELEKVVSSSDFDDWFSLNDTIMGGSSKAVCRASSKGLSLEGVVAVSYTHLTLPTKRIV